VTSLDGLPAETPELLSQLATMGSYRLGAEIHYDWDSIEAALGIGFPTQFRAYVQAFPSGGFRRLTIFHPASSQGPRKYGLVERILDSTEAFRGWAETFESSPYTFYPDANGIIPWADYEGDYYLCWLPNNVDPDRWPVVAYRDPDEHERFEGSTLQVLIRVLRGDIGRSFFPEDFYDWPTTFSGPPSD
jgi:hypothetical protein